MNAVVRPIREGKAAKAKPVQETPEQTRLFPRGVPVQLTPIQWGKRDRNMARGICRLVKEATPPREIPFDPTKEAHLRRTLRSYGMSH